MPKRKLPQNATEAADAGWQLALKYKQVFSTQAGREILEDLESRFGYNLASCVYGMTATDAFLSDGMKAPIRHIHWMLNRKSPSEIDLPTEAQK